MNISVIWGFHHLHPVNRFLLDRTRPRIPNMGDAADRVRRDKVLLAIKNLDGTISSKYSTGQKLLAPAPVQLQAIVWSGSHSGRVININDVEASRFGSFRTNNAERMNRGVGSATDHGAN
jgi:hypothetical protein